MNNIGLFAVGFVVTLLVAGSMTLLVWGAIMDGRYDEARRAELDDAAPVRRDRPAPTRDAA